MSRRTRAREIVLKCLYTFETLEKDAREVFEEASAATSRDVATLEFASSLYRAIIEKVKKLDEDIAEIAENWDIKRLAVVDRNILRIAICELFYFPDIPAKVSINEAIELAKKYSTMDSASFVNGILDAIYQRHLTELEQGKVPTD